jgi:hypothetical protein
MKLSSIVFSLIFIMTCSIPSFAGGKGEAEPIKAEKADPRCANRGERGPCKALIESWHYDPGSNSCKPFFWGGCGEPKPFSSEKECLSVCAGKSK